VQILPAIQPIVSQAKVIIRTPSWILPDIGTEASAFTLDQIQEFIEKPELLMERRKENERTMNSVFGEIFLG
jgi:hypothetical protein